jgi:hypothetical protein
MKKVNLAYSHQLLCYASTAVGFLDEIRILIKRPFNYIRSVNLSVFKFCKLAGTRNFVFNTPTKCIYTIKIHVLNITYSPTCFGAYCAIVREKFFCMLRAIVFKVIV